MRMLTVERTHNSVITVPVETKLLEKNHIFVEGQVTAELAENVKRQIMYLVDKSPDQPIIMHINSVGGEVTAGLEIYDIIQSYSDRIYIVCTGKAYSIAAVILAGGAKGKRFILPNSETMVHEPLISNGVSGNCSTLNAISDRLLRNRERLNNILSKHIGRPKEEIDAATAYDHFYSAEESVEFGICDKIADFKEIMEGKLNG